MMSVDGIDAGSAAGRAALHATAEDAAEMANLIAVGIVGQPNAAGLTWDQALEIGVQVAAVRAVADRISWEAGWNAALVEERRAVGRGKLSESDGLFLQWYLGEHGLNPTDENYIRFARCLRQTGQLDRLLAIEVAARSLIEGQYGIAAGVHKGPDPKPEDFTYYVPGAPLVALREALSHDS